MWIIVSVLVQAIACANVGAALISPFVGRILDWHKKAEGRDFDPIEVWKCLEGCSQYWWTI